MPPVPYLRDSRAPVPINLASSKKATCSCLVRFSTTFPCPIWAGLARELIVAAIHLYVLHMINISVGCIWP